MNGDVPGDLIVQVAFDGLILTINHEGLSGDLTTLAATLMQLPERWSEVVAATFTLTAVAEADDE